MAQDLHSFQNDLGDIQDIVGEDNGSTPSLLQKRTQSCGCFPQKRIVNVAGASDGPLCEVEGAVGRARPTTG